MSVCNEYWCRVCGGVSNKVETSGIRDWEFGIGGDYEYRRCLRCLQIQLHPFPTVQDMMGAYPDNYNAHTSEARDKSALYNALFSLANLGLRRRLKQHLQTGAKVLDVGCGNGEFLMSVKKLGAITLEGVDFNVRAVALARQKGVNVFRGLFVEYPGELASYDAIFMNHYIEHVLDPVAELKKAKALLRSSGMLFGEAPNFGSVDRKIFGRYWGGNHVPRHTFQFEPDRLYRLLRDAGFKSIVITSELNTGMIAKSIQNYLQRNVKSLSNNSRLKHGRIKQFDLLLLAAIPFNIVLKLIGKSGVMKFTAIA